MATYKKSDVVLGGNGMLPKDRYTVRIQKCKKSKSAAGNPMITTEVEVISPEEVQIDGRTAVIAGRKHTFWNVLDPSVTWGVGRIIEALEKANFDFSKFENDDDSFDDEKVNLLEGFCMDMILDSRERVARKQLTPEDRLAKKKEGDPILDGEGREIKLGWEIIGDWSHVVGPATGWTNNPSW